MEGEKSLVFSLFGIGDAIVSLPGIERLQDNLHQTELYVGAWSEQQEELFSSQGYKTIRLPWIHYLKKRVYRKEEWPKIVGAFGEFVGILREYNSIYCPVATNFYFNFAQWYKRVFFWDGEKIKETSHYQDLAQSQRFVGFSIQDKVEALFGRKIEDGYLPTKVKIPLQNKYDAQRIWENSNLVPHSSVVLNMRTNDFHKSLIFDQVDQIVNFTLSAGRTPVFVNYSEEQEKRLCDRFPVQSVNFISSKSILTIGAVIGESCAYIGGDTGLTHFAAVEGVPTIALFGPTDKEVWVDPRHENVSVFQSDVPCRTLACRNLLRCNQTSVRCMEQIDMGQVLNTLGTLLN